MSRYRFFMNRYRGLGFILSLFVYMGCPNNPSLSPCNSECKRGFICDLGQGICLPQEHRKFDGEIIGRAFDLTIGLNEIYISGQNDAGEIIVSKYTNKAFSDTRVLFSAKLPLGKRTQIDATEKSIAVVWREGQSYIFAHREFKAPPSNWSYTKVKANAPYLATEDFSLTHQQDSFVLVFRDGKNILKSLRIHEEKRVREEKNAEVEVVDIGNARKDVGCKESVPSLGFDITTTRYNDEIIAAYFDERCANLRIARRKNSAWKSSVVDDGNRAGAFFRVGGHPALVVNNEGTVFVSYQNLDEKSLSLAFEEKGRFVKEIIDNGATLDVFARRVFHRVGEHSDLLVLPNKKYVVYYDATHQSLRFSSYINAEWKTRTINEGPFIVGMNSKLIYLKDQIYIFAEKITSSETGLKSSLFVTEFEE